MRLGAHIFLFTDHWADDCFWVFDEARRLDLDCLDIAVGDDVSFDVSACRRLAEDNEIVLMISPGAAWPMDCDISADDPAHRRKGIDWHKQQIERGHALGAVAYTGAIYGHTGVVHKRRPPAEEYPRCAAGLLELATFADEHGMLLALEPMSHFRTHIANTPQQILQLIEQADSHPALRIAFDTYHAVTEVRDYAAAIDACGDRLWALQACESDRSVPGGGLVPWSALFDALRRNHFDGCVLLETYNSSIGDFAFERGMFHDPCPDYEEFISNGMQFLKQGLY